MMIIIIIIRDRAKVAIDRNRIRSFTWDENHRPDLGWPWRSVLHRELYRLYRVFLGDIWALLFFCPAVCRHRSVSSCNVTYLFPTRVAFLERLASYRPSTSLFSIVARRGLNSCASAHRARDVTQCLVSIS